MRSLKRSPKTVTFACSTILLGAFVAGPVAAATDTMAEKGEQVESQAQDLTEKTSDAWREGKLDTVFLLNRHLNNFTIDPEVRGTSVTLTGTVESEVDKELAEQLALGVDGIESVDNDLEVGTSNDERDEDHERDRKFSDRIEDATLTAEVKMKLLANGETSGLSINVDTQAREVTLQGEVDSSAERDLAVQLAKNVDGVMKVHDKLTVESS